MEAIDNRTPLSNRGRQATVNLLICDCPRRKFFHYLLGVLSLTILILLVVVIVKATANKSSDSPLEPERIYHLERVWPAAICLDTQCMATVPTKWAVTRFSTYEDDKVLTKCSKADVIKPEDFPKELKDNLSKLWPAFVNSAVDTTLWIDAWNIDGTCTGWTTTKEEKPWVKYFDNVVKLASTPTIESRLEAKKVKPQPIPPYSPSEVQKALSNKTVALNCRAVDKDGYKYYYITSIVECYHTVTVTEAGKQSQQIVPIDCPKGNCTQPFFYLP